MDTYWSVIYSIAGFGAALIAALAIAAVLTVGPVFGARALIRRQRAGAAAAPAARVPVAARARSATPGRTLTRAA